MGMEPSSLVFTSNWWGWSLFVSLGAVIITRKPNLTTLIEFFYLESLAVVHEEE